MFLRKRSFRLKISVKPFQSFVGVWGALNVQ